MHGHAYRSQCAEAQRTRSRDSAHPRAALTLFALALGTFAIGSGEFGSNGIIQLFASSLGVGIPTATNAITAYAVGVIVGSPVIALAAARVNRRTLLLCLMGSFLAGNVLSACSVSIGMLAAARLLTGVTQGAYFGAAAVVASYVMGPGNSGKAFSIVMGGLTVAAIVGSPLATVVGQGFGWQATYVGVTAIGILATLALVAWVPRTSDLAGASVGDELSALRKPSVWLVIGVAALGISSIFAVYTFIGTFVTDAVGLSESFVPLALVVFGLGMTLGNLLGGRVADRRSALGVIGGLGGVLPLLVVIGVAGAHAAVLFPALFGVGATMMFAVPSVQVRLSAAAPDAPTLVGALNLSALNVANTLGAVGGAITVDAGLGVLSTVWAGLALTSAGLLLFGVSQVIPARRRGEQPAAAGLTAR